MSFIKPAGLALLFLSLPLFASDLEKEKRWADQIIDTLLDGEPVYLEDGKSKFLALDTEAESPGETAVILLHGIGVHPDWPQVNHPLRVGLAENGWRTLSIQMPILPNEAESKDYIPIMAEATPRIAAAVEYLKAAGAKQTVIVAHSLGSRMAGPYLLQADPVVSAYAGIGMSESTVEFLKQLKIPVLDLYGENDNQNVLDSKSARKNSGSANPKYQQLEIAGADHFFSDMDDELVELVSDWLRELP